MGRIDDHHCSAHFRMDITEDVANPWRVESHGVGSASFVQAKIKSLSVKQRKDIVKERIEVGEIDNRPDRNCQNMRLKPFMLLQDLEARPGGTRLAGVSICRTSCRFQPDDGV